ncbi:alveolar macrophage chemotactic factor-like [Carettochelys insculpta]|uniref:alveolar macrophage chemotactic factor-like n=1 Tax=Carettochelys insculpta TaxID=44489 RepID=UPI003EC09505
MRPSSAILLICLLGICHSAYAAILEANSSYKNCRCTKLTSDFIHPKKYESIEIIPLGGTCRTTEIILKLKTGKSVCVNPRSPWIKRVLANLQNQKEQRALPQIE